MSDGSRGNSERVETRPAALQALAWLRERFPQARLTSLVIPSDEAIISVRVDVAVNDGPASAGHGVALAIEAAEDRAIVRAAEGLGYREAISPVEARPAPRSIAPPTPVEEPVPTPIPVRPTESHPEPPRDATPRQGAPAPMAGRSGQMVPPVIVRPRAQVTPVRGNAPTATSPRSTLRPVPDIPESDDNLADVSWTEFWKWARARGYDSREAINEAIGRSMDGLTPRDVRALVRRELGESDE
ncbi:hypothetical protein BH09CHL1_BH09CHL1_06930 [soil metagenome]